MKTNKSEIYKNAFRLFLQDNYEKVTVVKPEKAIGLSCRDNTRNWMRTDGITGALTQGSHFVHADLLKTMFDGNSSSGGGEWRRSGG